MNEEEKIAFNYYKGCNENDLNRFDDFSEVSKKTIKYTETLLHLIDKQQQEIKTMKTKINKIVLMIRKNYDSDWYDDYETIAGLRDDIYNLLTKNKGE